MGQPFQLRGARIGNRVQVGLRMRGNVGGVNPAYSAKTDQREIHQGSALWLLNRVCSLTIAGKASSILSRSGWASGGTRPTVRNPVAAGRLAFGIPPERERGQHKAHHSDQGHHQRRYPQPGRMPGLSKRQPAGPPRGSWD